MLRDIKWIKILKIFTISLVVINVAYMLFIGVNIKVLIPDEGWFFSLINSTNEIIIKNPSQIWYTPNHLNYGSIYWIFFGLINNLFVIRLISVVAILSIMVLIFMVYKRIYNNCEEKIYYAILIWLASPFAWFSGKIIGPEILSLAIGAWGCYIVILNKKNIRFIGVTLIGISTGIKLNNIIFFVFISSFLLVGRKVKIRIKIKELFIYVCTFVIGFIIANPIIIFAQNIYISNLVNLESFSLKYLFNILLGSNEVWDLVYTAGFFKSVVSLPLFIVLVILTINKKKIASSVPIFYHA